MIKTRLKELISKKIADEGLLRINMRKLSKEIGVSRNALYTWLSDEGVSHIHTDTLDAFCEYFKCQVGDLLVHIPNQEPKPN